MTLKNNYIMKCNHCKNKTIIHLLDKYPYSVERQDDPTTAESPEIEQVSHVLIALDVLFLQCATCEEPILAKRTQRIRKDPYYNPDGELIYSDNIEQEHTEILYPHLADSDSLTPDPINDMPSEIIEDYNEARAILLSSPRSSAALLRLAIQKLCKYLGQPGKNINDDIATLVKNGLPIRIQQALDIVRVIGNNAVHPGSLDIKDDLTTVSSLFTLVNMIVEEMITRPKALEEMYNRLPEQARESIEKRDKGKS